MSPTPAWIDSWLTPGRYAKYHRAAGGNHQRALALYTWNAKLAAALLGDLGHVEIALRNSYDAALLAHPAAAGGDWLEPATYNALFAPHMAPDKNGRLEDKNKTPRKQISQACRRSGFDTPGSQTPRGKVIAELMFGFWSYLTDTLHEKPLWVPALHHAFTPGTDRARLHKALTELRELRNRIAHHESVFDQGPENHRRSILFVSHGCLRT